MMLKEEEGEGGGSFVQDVEGKEEGQTKKKKAFFSFLAFCYLAAHLLFGKKERVVGLCLSFEFLLRAAGLISEYSGFRLIGIGLCSQKYPN